MRTTLCVRFKSEVVACGVAYAAARRFQVPLPENPPWWKAFDAEKSGIDEVCRVLAHLYSLPKAHYIPVCKDGDSFTFANKSSDSQSQPLPEQEVSQSSPLNSEVSVSKAPSISANLEGGESKGMLIKVGMDKLKEGKKGDDESKSVPFEGEAKQEPMLKSRSERRTEASGVDKSKERDRIKATDRDRGRDSDWEREREEADRDRDKVKDRSNRSKDGTKDFEGTLRNQGITITEIAIIIVLILCWRRIVIDIIPILEGVNAWVYSKQKPEASCSICPI